MFNRTEEFSGLNSTINVCENCTLKCSYCYEFNKAQSPSEDIKFWTEVSNSKDPVRAALGKEILDIADYSFANGRDDGIKPIITMDMVERYFDLLLSKESSYNNDDIASSGLIIDLIGGDALQYPDLIEQIIECVTYKMYKFDTPLARKMREHWRLSASSNGVTLLTDRTRELLSRWNNQISLGISVDGCPELHDLNRWLYPDDKRHKIDPVKYPKHIGSFKYIMANWDFYREHFLTSALRTKWTMVPNSYKYIMKSVKYLHEELGMVDIFFNRAMEDCVVDTPETVKILVEQFDELLDYALERDDELCITPLTLYSPNTNISKETKSCGFGHMPALGIDGNVYSCFRLLPHGKVDTRSYKQGDVFTDLIADRDMLNYIQNAACIMNIKYEGSVYDKYNKNNDLLLNCTKCPILSRCGACTAGCMLNAPIGNGKKVPFIRTTSNCWFHKVQSVYSLYYLERAGIQQLTSSDLQVRALLEKDIKHFIELGDSV